MMYCPRCTAIDLADLLPGSKRLVRERYRWHDNLDSLRISAESECILCKLAYEPVSKCSWLLPEWGVDLGLDLDSTELEVWLGPPNDSHVKIEAFRMCIERSGLEIETGQRDHNNNGSVFIKGRPLYHNASSDQCFDLARAWLRYCVSDSEKANSSHTLCHDNLSPGFIPTRTLNVGTPNSTREPFLQIHDGPTSIADSGPPASFATLSYCWGGKADMVTTTTNLEERKHSIPFDSMPRTFKDAIQITRELGIEHLWIDSLCILQDSPEDWLRESLDMANVYRHGLINIAAEASCHTNDGIFRHRKDNDALATLPFTFPKAPGSSFSIQDALSSLHSNEGEVSLHHRLDDWADSLEDPNNSPLSKRGWVLQELLLSPRTIHFGHEQIFWACAGGSIAEGDMSPSPKRVGLIEEKIKYWHWSFNKQFLKPIPAMSDLPSDKTSEIWYQRWYGIVNNYSKRHLTYQSDIFPALSGLTQIFESHLKDHCIAGLFAGDLSRGLCWQAELDLRAYRRGFAGFKTAAPARAPTWSWASIVGEVSFQVACYNLSEWNSGDIVELRFPSSKTRHSRDPRETSIALEARGYLLSNIRGKQAYKDILANLPLGSYSPEVMPKRPNEEIWSKPCSILQLNALPGDIFDFEPGSGGCFETRVYGLILHSRPGEDCFERVGFLEYVFKHTMALRRAEVLKNANWKQDMWKERGWEIKTITLI